MEDIENVAVNIIDLSQIHNDLGLLTSILIFFVIVILCYFAYKFFDMFFKI